MDQESKKEMLIKKLQNILAEDFGREVSTDEASVILRDMTAYFDLLTKMHHASLTENN